MTPPRWAPLVLAAVGAALLPWTLWLGFALPSRKVADHWDVAWAGFDVFLAASLLGTAFTLRRDSPLVRAFAAATAALLIADAWFDIVTSSPGRDLWLAIALAAAGELPLAALCLVLARPRRTG
jgi:hypothetical protein